MSKREYRRFTAEQKIEILREADQPGVTVSEVCRRHGLPPSVLYRWRAVAQGGSTVALKLDAQRKTRKDDAETRHKAEIDRLRAVVAEITAENLELKKGFEVRGFIASLSTAQSRSDPHRETNKTALRMAGAPHAGGSWAAPERLLRLAATRKSGGSDWSPLPGV
jgi:transposase